MLAPEGVNSMRVLDGNGGVHDLQIKELCDARLDYLEEAPVTAAPQTTLKVERAFYSEDRPIEFWRDLSGFIEAKS
jgi:hypothetical protein